MLDPRGTAQEVRRIPVPKITIHRATNYNSFKKGAKNPKDIVAWICSLLDQQKIIYLNYPSQGNFSLVFIFATNQTSMPEAGATTWGYQTPSVKSPRIDLRYVLEVGLDEPNRSFICQRLKRENSTQTICRDEDLKGKKSTQNYVKQNKNLLMLSADHDQE